MTPVITAAMSKLIKVVGSLSHFHAEFVQRDSFHRDETSRQLRSGTRERKKRKRTERRERERERRGGKLFGNAAGFHDDSLLRDFRENFP